MILNPLIGEQIFEFYYNKVLQNYNSIEIEYCNFKI